MPTSSTGSPGKCRPALALFAGLATALASAQDAEPAWAIRSGPDVDPGPTIFTGSYLPDFESGSPLPVTVYSANILQKIGANTPVEGLRQLPSFVGNTATENDSNGGNGSAFVALRGLGPGNTLTLINGRRAFGFANVNAIPLGALDRVEVLKDGAGAIYGSGAVAGVANFILLNGPGATPYGPGATTFNGVELDLLYGNTTDKDARVIQGYLRSGFSNEKMALAFAAEYYDREALFARDREVSSVANNIFRGGNNLGSATFPGRITLGGSAAQGGGARIQIYQTALPTGPASYRPYGGAPSPDPLNFRLYTPSIPAQEKYLTYVTGSYNIFGKAMVFYADLLYAKTKQDNALAPVPFTLTRGAYSVAAVAARSPLNRTSGDGVELSPFNPFGVFNAPSAGGPSPSRNLTAVPYRLVNEAGNRRSFYDQDYWRYTAGLRGQFVFKLNPVADYLSYDGGMVYERFDNLRIDSGDIQRSLLVNEIDQTVLNPSYVGFNPFVPLGAPAVGTAPVYDRNGVQTGTRAYDNVAAAARAGYVGRSFFHSHDFLIDARLAGNLLPWLPQGGIGFNVGLEFRQSRTTQLPDPVQVAGDQLGFNASPNTKYKQEVRSYFAECSLPLVTQKMKIPLVRSLDFSAAIRYEEFDNFDQRTGGFFDPTAVDLVFLPGARRFNSGVRPRFTLRYQPVEDLTLRASYSESFRAPSPTELFDPPVDTPVNIGHPLLGPFLVPVRQGGNANLTPETSKSWNVGLVFAPRWVKGLSLTVDYYQIHSRNVFVPSADLAQLLPFLDYSNLRFPFRDRVFLDPDSGIPTLILAQTANAGKRFVSGLDTVLTYQMPYERFGNFTFSLGANYFFSWKAEPFAGSGSTNFLGDYNNGTQPLAPGAIPRLKGFFRTEWSWRGFEWTGTLNYIGEFHDDPAFVGVLGPNPRTVPSYITFDTQLSYEFKRPRAAVAMEMFDGKGVRTQVAADNSGTFAQRLLWGTRIRVGVVNLFDRSPPTVLGAFNDTYDTSLYSSRNRYVYIGLNKKF